MPLQKLQFNPGINRETTSYSNEGGWYDGDKIRFRCGYPEKIGGWVKRSVKSFLGSARSLHAFSTLDGTNYLAFGTNEKYYLDLGGGYKDITPLRLTTSAGAITFSADTTNFTSELTVSHTAHGATEGDFVTYEDAVTLNGNISAAVLNQEYKIDEIIDDDSYKITAREVEPIDDIIVDGVYTPNAVTPTSSDTGNGGTGVIGKYQINTGIDVAVSGTGWGAGSWGRGTWGSTSTTTTDTSDLRLFTEDNYGEDLVFNLKDGEIFFWDASVNVSSDPADAYGRAVTLASLSSDATCPTIAKQVMVSDVDRHIIAFGCDPENDIGNQDPLLIRFSDQEDVLVWQTLETNTAGDLRIGTGSKIVTAVETRQQILVWTDKSLHAMQYIGTPYTFGISMLSENITIAGPKSAVAVDDSVFWMGSNEFYTYNGAVQRIPCTVRDYVFSDFNIEQYEKVTAGVNSAFGEVWWFYCSADSIDNDRYVVYNYQQQIWYYGTLSRTVWLDRGIMTNPSAASQGYIYTHETGFDDGSQDPVVPVYSHIQSSPMDIGEGDKFVSISRILPDITFRDSTSSTPKVDFSVYVQDYPGGGVDLSQTNNGQGTYSGEVERTNTASENVFTLEGFTNKIDTRIRGRSFIFKVQSDETQVAWRLGSPRLDIRLDGRR